MKITRQNIIDSLKKTLEPKINVFAFWLEGADAHNRVDKYSDIDIWIDVKDGDEEKIFQEIENVLKKFGKVDFSHEVDHSHPKIRQKFFHIKGTSEFLVVDTCIQKHSRVFWYTNEFKDEKVKIIFDKKNVVTFKELNKSEFKKDLKSRISELKKTFLFFQVWPKKEIKRQHFLEALGLYHEKVLKPLVELLRIKYEPTKKEYYLKDVSKDLPKKVLIQLEDLYKINSIKELEKKVKKANKIFLDNQ